MTQANHSNQIGTGVHKNEHEDIEAAADWIVVTRKLPPEEHSAGVGDDGQEHKLILPATARDRMEAEYVGTVVSIGEDAQIKQKKMKLGDRIVYGRCFPMARQGSKTEIFSLVHKDSVMGYVRHLSMVPGMAPEQDGFRQS